MSKRGKLAELGRLTVIDGGRPMDRPPRRPTARSGGRGPRSLDRWLDAWAAARLDASGPEHEWRLLGRARDEEE